MDTKEILAGLRAERDRMNQAIAALEALDSTSPSLAKRGRKPAASTAPAQTAAKKRVVSPQARKRMAAAQKARWARKHDAKPVVVEKRVVKKAAKNTRKKAAKKAAPGKAKRVVSPESRKKMAAAQQKRWSQQKRAATPAGKKSPAPLVS
jgi:hypothetical protein